MLFAKAGAAVATHTNVTLNIGAIHTTEKSTAWHIVVPWQASLGPSGLAMRVLAEGHTKLLNRKKT